MDRCMLTTMDNPNNPFTEFTKWWHYDHAFGYNSSEVQAFFAKTSLELEDDQYNEEVNHAIDLALELNPFGLYMKVYESDADKQIKLANKVYHDIISKQKE